MFWGQGVGRGRLRRRPARAVGVCAALGLLLAAAGCSGQGEQDPTEQPTEPVTVEPTETEPTETEPTEPEPDPDSTGPQDYEHPVPGDAINENTQEGAEAAAVYFLELYYYAYATGDLEEWNGLSGENCGFCSGVAERIEERYESGGYVVVGTLMLEDVASVIWPEEQGDYLVTIRTGSTTMDYFDAAGRPEETHEGSPVAFDAVVVYGDYAWRVAGAAAEELS